MKTLPVILLQCLSILTSASTEQAYIYTHDVRSRSSSHPNAISPETAYSIWARRLGLSERRQLSSIEASVLQEIDLFGGYQPVLFRSSQEQAQPSRLSIIAEGFDEDVTGLEQYPHLIVAKPSQELTSGLKTKTLNADGGSNRIFNWTFATKDKLNVFLEIKFAEHHHGARLEQLESLLRLRDTEKEHFPHLLSMLELGRLSYPASGDTIEIASLQLDYTAMTDTTPHEKSAMIRELLSYLNPRLASFATSGSQESTLVLLPTAARSPRSLSKHTHFARQAQEEEEEALSTPSLPELSTTQSNASHPPKLAPGTFLPTCFSSEPSCMNATNSCSGHGSCSKKHAGCYACSCARTIVRYNDDGTTKSVQWGGTACEKKDISVEFWLFASLGIVTALVAGVIGMLYGMGAEELPSVIGAGVAGPRATK